MATEKDYLTDMQKEQLGWVCEDDGFINDINLIINSVLQKKHLQECDPDTLYPKNSFFANRDKNTKPANIKREMGQLLGVLAKLSPSILGHIVRNGCADEYLSLMNVLKIPYQPSINGRINQLRLFIVERVNLICKKYEIEPKVYEKNGVFKIVKLICEVTNLPYSTRGIVCKLSSKD